MPRELLVAGASGVVGRAVLRHSEGREDWRVTGLSRRLLDVPGTVRVLLLDLRGPASCGAAVAGQLSSITHLVCCATAEKPNHAAVSEAMLRNLLNPACNGETFIVNGDVFTWKPLWPQLAAYSGMAVAVPAPARLARITPSHAGTWRRAAS